MLMTLLLYQTTGEKKNLLISSNKKYNSQYVSGLIHQRNALGFRDWTVTSGSLPTRLQSDKL